MNHKRKLASIRQISEIKPHTNADALEIAIVDGWQCVIKKGEFRPGDKAVYFEVDSVLPVRPEFEFLRKSCYIEKDWLPAGEGFRLKTIRLRGELSQGLLIPVSKLFDESEVHVGQDVTELLNVVKWDPPVPAQLAGLARGNFPSFIQKTDQERIQNIWTEVKQQYNELAFEVTVKLDGSSCTYYHNNGDVGVCSRNLSLKLEGNEDNTFVKYALDNNVLEVLSQVGDNIAIQGEMIGPGIQGNREKLQKPEFFVFDIYLIDDQRYATRSERMFILEKIKALTGKQFNHVPYLGEMTLEQFNTIEDILSFAEGPSLNHPVREGIVFKSVAVVNGSVPSFKVISNRFLLETGN